MVFRDLPMVSNMIVLDQLRTSMRRFIILVAICILVVSRANGARPELLDKVNITGIDFFQKGKLVKVVTDDAPVRIRAYLRAREIMPEFKGKFLLIFSLDRSTLATFPISDILYTPFVDYLWEKPTSGVHSIGASLSTAAGAGETVYCQILVEEVKPVLKINSLEIDTSRRLKVSDKVKFFLFVSNDSEKPILPDDFVARLELRCKEPERTILLNVESLPRISPKAHNISLGPVEWMVEDGNWLVYPQILPRVVGNRKVIEVVQTEDIFLDLRIGESRPDLVVDFSLSPASPYMGEKADILVNLENIGDLPCEKYQLFLYIDGKRKGSITEGPTISSGKTKNFQFEWTAERGTHYLKVSAPYEFDQRGFLTKAELPLTVEAGIDVLPIILSWKPADPQSGDVVTISARVENSGVSAIIPWREDAEAGYKAILSVNGIEKQAISGDEIKPGESSDFEFAWQAEEGEHLLKFSFLYIPGQDIEPLSWSGQKSIRVAPPPRLVCVRDDWTPNPPTEGDIVSVSLVVKNDGGGMARLWDEQEMVGYKILFLFGSERREATKRIPPGKEVTFSFRWSVGKAGEYPVKVLFIHPSGKEIAKPYTGNLYVLSPEPIDELDRDTLKFMEKRAKKKASLYRALVKNLDGFFSPPHSKLRKLAVKSTKIALDLVDSILEERQGLSLSGINLSGEDLEKASKNLQQILENIARIDWSATFPLGGKVDSEYASLREYVSRSFFSENGIARFVENETEGFRQMEANIVAVKEGENRPYPDAKNGLLKVLKAEEKLATDVSQDLDKDKSQFVFLKKQAEKEKRAEIQLRVLYSMVNILRSEGERARELEKELYQR